jgi:hypothetical protein
MVCGDQSEELATSHYWQISRLCGEQTANHHEDSLADCPLGIGPASDQPIGRKCQS